MVLVLALLFSICLKVISVKFDIPLKRVHISATWSRIFLILIMVVFVAISVRTGIDYKNMIVESGKLLNELKT